MSTELAAAPISPGFQKATSQLSASLGIEPRMMIESLKKQCFPGMRPEDISDPQLAAFISVANAMQLNPLIPGMLYGYPSKNGGIIPVCGPDGVLKKLDEAITDNKLDGYECEVFPLDVVLPPTHAVAKIFRAGKEHPSTFTAIFKEWVVSSNPNWSARPRHMLWLRAIKQCARQVIHGVPFDEDDIKIGDMVNVTPQEEKIERPPPPKRAAKGVAAVQEATKPAPAIDVETVPTKAAVTPPPEQAPPAPEKQAEPAKPEPPKTPAPTPGHGSAPRTTLKEAETVDLRCVVQKNWGLIMKADGKDSPSVQADVTGEFTGKVYQFGTGLKDPSGEGYIAGPEWTVGNAVVLTLFGRINKKSGAILPVVTKLVQAEAQTEDQSVDVG